MNIAQYFDQFNVHWSLTIGIAIRNIIAFAEARMHLSRLMDEVRQGAEKIITKNGEPVVAIIDARRLDYHHSLERDRVHLLLLDEVEKGLADVASGRTGDALQDLAARQAHHKAKMLTKKVEF